MELTRRNLFGSAGILATSLIFGEGIVNGMSEDKTSSVQEGENNIKMEVTAIEDLMREHGVLRRALFVYSESANRLVKNPAGFPTEALQKTAKIFRSFGEEYHERKLEEGYIFPGLKKEAARLTDILITQHNSGREITDYILAVTKTKLSDENAKKIVDTLRSFVRMYRPHAAREDTIIFPAWKQTLTAKQLDEMGDKFEDIEHEQFGKDGFENAVKEITAIEKQLGLADLSQFTAPAIAL
jgi:hemerythrin-like domain-containing protein